jgi:hypothetical protein
MLKGSGLIPLQNFLLFHIVHTITDAFTVPMCVEFHFLYYQSSYYSGSYVATYNYFIVQNVLKFLSCFLSSSEMLRSVG